MTYVVCDCDLVKGRGGGDEWHKNLEQNHISILPTDLGVVVAGNVKELPTQI